MKVLINGDAKELASKASVTDALTSENVDQPDTVSVQLNGEFLDKSLFPTTALNDGDELEFLYFMGGGQ